MPEFLSNPADVSAVGVDTVQRAGDGRTHIFLFLSLVGLLHLDGIHSIPYLGESVSVLGTILRVFLVEVLDRS